MDNEQETRNQKQETREQGNKSKDNRTIDDKERDNG